MTDLFDDPQVRAILLPAVRDDFRLSETYEHRPGPPLTCPVREAVPARRIIWPRC